MAPGMLTPDHEALRAEVRRWAQDRLAARAEQLEHGGQVADVAAEAGALGYLGAGYPEQVGGGGGDLLAAVVVAEELGRCRTGGVAACLLAQAHVGVPLAAAGPVTELVAEALAGGRPLALVDGPPTAVLNARRASAVLVVDEPRVLLATAGWRVTDADSAGLGWHGADLARVDLTGASTVQVADGLEAAAAVDAQRRRWWLMAGAAAVAGAWVTWEEARAYALQREAFGRAVGRFQVNRHGLADAAGRLTAARALVHDLAVRAAAGEDSAPQAAAAWWYATAAAAAVSDLGLQLHGGYGYTMEYPVQRAWRDDRMAGWGPAGLERAREQVLAGLAL